MSQLYFCLFNHRKLFICCAKKITCMEIVCWLSEHRKESNAFPLTLFFPVVSPSHVHSCFEKQVLMLQLFDVGSCLRARGTPAKRAIQSTSLQACLWWGCRSTLLSPYPAQIILRRAKLTRSGHCRTGVEPKLFFLVPLLEGGESSLPRAGSSHQRRC